MAPTYSVIRHGGRAVFSEDGRPVALPSYCCCGPGWKDRWLEAHRNVAAHGRRIFWLMPGGGYNGEWGTTPFWTGPGEIHDSPVAMPPGYLGLAEQAQAILEIVPDARFFVRMMDMPPASWGKAYPGQMARNAEGKVYETPSLASELYLTELSAFLQALTRWCERQSWAERVIGYVIYPLGEGGTPLAMEGNLFDRSPAMQAAFLAYLAEKYATDAALQAAWGDATAHLATAAVPADDDFRRRSGGPVPFWPDAAAVQRERDYFELQPRLFRRYLQTMLGAFRTAAGTGRLCGIDALKANMVGWMCHPIFSGKGWREHYGDWQLATGATGVAEILDWPDLEIVATPHDYRCRWAGFGYDPEGIGDSVQLHGKIMFVEEDQRTYANNERGSFGSVEPGEEDAVFTRNLAASVTRGQHTYPMDVCVGYFGAEPVQRALQARTAAEDAFTNVPHQDVPGIVMLIDEGAAIYTDFSSEYADLAVMRQRIGGMNHCGVPARTFLFDDLERADFPSCHRLFLLPTCYRADDRTLDRLRRTLFRDGNVLVFGPGSGITDGVTVAAAFAERLTGIGFDLLPYEYPRFVHLDNWEHPLTAWAGACEMYGDSRRYGPVLVPHVGDGTVSLGTIALDNGKRRPGLVLREFGRGAAGNGVPGPRGPGDYAVVFTAAVPLPARLLRSLARYSGTHVYDEDDDVVLADAASVAVHAVKPGLRRLRLPGTFRVTDAVTGRLVGEARDEVRFSVREPVTRWFRLADCRG